MTRHKKLFSTLRDERNFKQVNTSSAGLIVRLKRFIINVPWWKCNLRWRWIIGLRADVASRDRVSWCEGRNCCARAYANNTRTIGAP